MVLPSPARPSRRGGGTGRRGRRDRRKRIPGRRRPGNAVAGRRRRELHHRPAAARREGRGDRALRHQRQAGGQHRRRNGRLARGGRRRRPVPPPFRLRGEAAGDFRSCRIPGRRSSAAQRARPGGAERRRRDHGRPGNPPDSRGGSRLHGTDSASVLHHRPSRRFTSRRRSQVVPRARTGPAAIHDPFSGVCGRSAGIRRLRSPAPRSPAPG